MTNGRKMQENSRSARIRNPLAALALALTLISAGCAKVGYFQTRQATLADHPLTIAPPAAEHARSLAMFTGEGIPLGWNDVISAAGWADIIIVGEQHDDAVGHAVELAIAEDVMSRWPRSAVSLEMLERDEQPLLDDYFDGLIDAETLAKLTFSEKWAGEGSWTNWYQPLIDAAKNAEGGRGRAVAANAPRRYVRLARLEGYDRLRKLPAQRRRLFDLPRRAIDDSYRQRFIDLMSEAASHGDGSAGTEEDDLETKRRKAEDSFRSQSVWDATMAASIVRAKRAGATKVMHFVGQFHGDFNGGTVQQVRRRLPWAKILVISMQRDEVTELRDEDRGRADIVIYTGKRPPKEEEKPEEPPAEQTDETPPAEEPAPEPPAGTNPAAEGTNPTEG